MSDTRWLDEHEQHTWRSFLVANRLLFDGIERQLQQDSGLPHAYYEILVRLSEHCDHEMRMTELASALLNSKSGLTYQISQLEKAGLVRRRACPSDDRAVYAVLTPAGKRLLERAAPGHVALVRELFVDVLTPQQLDAVADGLGEVTRRLLEPEPARAR